VIALANAKRPGGQHKCLLKQQDSTDL